LRPCRLNLSRYFSHLLAGQPFREKAAEHRPLSVGLVASASLYRSRSNLCGKKSRSFGRYSSAWLHRPRCTGRGVAFAGKGLGAADVIRRPGCTGLAVPVAELPLREKVSELRTLFVGLVLPASLYWSQSNLCGKRSRKIRHSTVVSVRQPRSFGLIMPVGS